MPHSFCKLWIHALWSTRNRQPLISNKVENKVYSLVTEELIELGCPTRIVNGMPDHIHSLFLLNPQKSVSDIIKLVKGTSSHSINNQNIVSDKFSWQTGYAAYSVSESQLERVFQYIKNQKKHHSNKTFLQEYDELRALHGFGETNS